MSGNVTDEKMYPFQIRPDLRVRVHLYLSNHRTDTFAIALEYEWISGDWRRVVCIDNFGGPTHRDRYKPNGKHHARHETIFDSEDPDQAANWATDHLIENADAYVTQFHSLAEDTD